MSEGRRRGLAFAVLSASGIAGVMAAAPPPRADLTVRPGALVRWQGAGNGRCQIGAESFAPLDGVCWFPVDLLASGTLSVSLKVAGKSQTRRLLIGAYPYPEERIAIADDSKVNPSATDMVRIEAEQARVGALWNARGPRRFALPLQGPLAVLPASGRFGARRVFNGQPRNPHAGADYAVPTGTLVRAAAPGRVVLAEQQFFAGNAVYVDHGDGLVTMYFHLSALLVKTGEDVVAAQTIGKVGASGRVSGPHLHWAARWRGARVDPELLLRPAEAVALQ